MSEKFKLGKSPLALVVGQLGFSYAPELQGAGEKLRAPLRELGLPIAEPRQEVSVQFSFPMQQPNVRTSSVWLFTDPKKHRAVAIGPALVSFIVNKYDDFHTFSSWVSSVTTRIQEAFADLYFNNIGLRYFNTFVPEELPSSWLVESIRGMPTKGISTSHFHHKYEFWCDTGEGRLSCRCTLEHGGSVPKSLGFASTLFPKEHIHTFNDHIYHLDIMENSRVLDPQKSLNPETVKGMLNTQHENVESAFKNVVSESGKKAFEWQSI